MDNAVKINPTRRWARHIYLRQNGGWKWTVAHNSLHTHVQFVVCAMLATDVRSLFVWQLDRDEGQKKQFSLPFSLLLSFFHARGRACARTHTHSADVASQYFAVWQRGISSTIVIKFRYFLFTPVSPKVLTCSSVCSDFFFTLSISEVVKRLTMSKYLKEHLVSCWKARGLLRARKHWKAITSRGNVQVWRLVVVQCVQ